MRSGRVAPTVFALCVLAAGFAAPVYAAVHGAPARHVSSDRSWVDRGVDAISDDALLHTDPRTLVDPGRAVVANRVAAIRRPLFFVWAFAQIFALWYLWRSGAAARLRVALTRISANRIVLRALYACALVLIVTVVTFPFDVFGLHLSQLLGLSREAVLPWLQDLGISVALEMATVSIVVVIVLELVDRTRYWYLYATGLLLAFGLSMLIINPLYIAPLFHRYTPLSPQSALGARLMAIERRAGVGNVPIFVTNLSRTTEVGNAFVAGVGPTKRVVVGDTLLRTATPREIAFVMAHELGHDRHGDAFRITLLTNVLVILVIALAVVTAERVPVRSDDDALSRLALIAALGYFFALICLPVGNAYSRHVEAGADRFGLSVTHDPAAAARMFVRFADEGFTPICPPRAVELYFYDHPPLESRIDAAAGNAPHCP